MHSKPKILVTGGAGYIGSHVCKALSQSGFLPVCYDDLSRGHEWAVKWGPLERGCIKNRSQMLQVFDRHKPAAVVHLAGLAYVGESEQEPAKYFETNVTGSINLFSAMEDHGLRKVVFSSSCSVYGRGNDEPITETSPCRPVSAYAASKHVVEQIMSEMSRTKKWNSCALRYFNAAGADPAGEIGECHNPEPHVIPNLLSAALTGVPFTINGNDYPTTDGTCVRDYVHVSDLAEAHVLAIRMLLSSSERHTVLNLGNELPVSVLDLRAAVERVTHLKVNTKNGKRRDGDPAFLVANASLARNILGWRPLFLSVDDHIRTAWQWMRRG